jgi:hypothetical protein
VDARAWEQRKAASPLHLPVQLIFLGAEQTINEYGMYQVVDSLRHFGLSKDTKDLVAVYFDEEVHDKTRAEEVYRKMSAVVQGTLGSLGDLGSLPEGKTNYKSIRKV